MNQLVIVAISLLIANVVFSYLHISHYRKILKQMMTKKEGYFGMGVVQSKLRSKKIVVLTTDQDGVITECQALSGMTVFARFKAQPGLVGQAFDRVPQQLIPEKLQGSLNSAVSEIQKKFTYKMEAN